MSASFSGINAAETFIKLALAGRKILTKHDSPKSFGLGMVAALFSFVSPFRTVGG